MIIIIITIQFSLLDFFVSLQSQRQMLSKLIPKTDRDTRIDLISCYVVIQLTVCVCVCVMYIIYTEFILKADHPFEWWWW